MVLQKYKKMEEKVVIPRATLNDMFSTFQKMESIISTIEILADEESMKAIRKSKEDLSKGRYVEGNMEDLDKIMKSEDEL
ncbi:hypothetical protein DRN69_01570 [Candidatus Pacearchaeota archaeon]|nr:MAG: hypothetical protein DRN69_01570 [Candidatus Pacearchaeota archaeon]